MGDIKQELKTDMGALKQGLTEDMDKLKKPARRIERMLWVIIGVVGFVTLLFGEEILEFVRTYLAVSSSAD